MRTFLLIVIFSTLAQIDSKGQNLKKVIKDRKSSYSEYYVLDSAQKIKHGPYFKLTQGLSNLQLQYYLLESGEFKFGEKEGYWEFYYQNSNQLASYGFYKDGKKDSIWVNYYPDGVIWELAEVQTATGSSLVPQDKVHNVQSTGQYKNDRYTGEWKYYSKDQKLIEIYDYTKKKSVFDINHPDINNKSITFIGGQMEFNYLLHNDSEFDKSWKKVNNKLRLTGGEIRIRLVIDEEGRTLGYQVLKDDVGNESFIDYLTKFLYNLDDKWSPKLENGVAQKSQCMVNFELNVDRKYTTSVNFGTSKTLYFYLKATITPEDLAE